VFLKKFLSTEVYQPQLKNTAQDEENVRYSNIWANKLPTWSDNKVRELYCPTTYVLKGDSRWPATTHVVLLTRSNIAGSYSVPKEVLFSPQQEKCRTLLSF